MTKAKFKKPQKVLGSKIAFRNAESEDADFIVRLRTDPEKGRYLSATSSEVSDQIHWLELYKDDDSQIYFIIENSHGEPCGTVRLYDPQGSSFCWGSWILQEGTPARFALESALMVYRYGRHCGFDHSHFDVRKGNVSVWKFHERFGAKKVWETDEDYFFEISEDAIDKALMSYAKYLDKNVKIQW